MATIRTSPTLRCFIARPPSSWRHQRRWAQVQDVRFLATHGSSSQEVVIAKYREKLEQRAKEQGLSDVHELKEVYKDKIQGLKRQAAVPGATAPLLKAAAAKPPSSESPFPSPPPPPGTDTIEPTRSASSLPSTSSPAASAEDSQPPRGLKTLSSFLDIEKTIALPQKEIEMLWRLRHAHDPSSLCATVPIDVWKQIQENAREHPQFVLPLPAALDAGEEKETGAQVNTDAENAGASIHFMQWTFPTPKTVTVLFTHLAEYKLRGEFASPHTTVTHHLELAEEKGLVLAQGSVLEGRGVSVEAGKWLVMCMQRFYGGLEGADRRKNLLNMFSRGDEGFSVEVLMEEAERLG
ncbi:ATP11-domain-containing protein [Aulographum hederae CBS 113979]|uniref:ATP11-domain-containing protein n=1 Tax=Aulographum hederae CBS 113979 TaxID=1176131 RepID=A0A6G1GU60_9PEZI|nr:ATP11-domain-containing protein [Aulographum hederae CBS 113979]